MFLIDNEFYEVVIKGRGKYCKKNFLIVFFIIGNLYIVCKIFSEVFFDLFVCLFFVMKLIGILYYLVIFFGFESYV